MKAWDIYRMKSVQPVLFYWVITVPLLLEILSQVQVMFYPLVVLPAFLRSENRRFFRRTSIIQYDEASLQKASRSALLFSDMEKLDGHGNSISIRLMKD